jgi:hypothetical protein
MALLKSRTYYKNLMGVFGSHQGGVLHAQAARLCVLYEDLRIEMYAASEQAAMPVMDALSADYRRLYFVRRAIATLQEFSSALNVLNSAAEFKKTALAQMDTSDRRDWDAAIQFFNANNQRLKDIRNDVGGHFGDAAARFVVENIGTNVVGSLEVIASPTRDGAGVLLPFAHYLAALALTKDHGEVEPDAYLSDTFDFVFDAFRHAAHSLHLLAAYHLVPKFGG